MCRLWVRMSSVTTMSRAGNRIEFSMMATAERDQAVTDGASVPRPNQHLRAGSTRLPSRAILHPFRMGRRRGDHGKTVGLGIKMEHLVFCPVHSRKPVRSRKSSRGARRRLGEGRIGFTRSSGPDLGGRWVIVVGSDIRLVLVQDGLHNTKNFRGVVLSTKSSAH